MKCVYVLVALLAVGLECRDVKSSLTIVIDHSYSMTDDIEQVRLNADALFDTVMNSNASQIEDFVLVGFSDPVYKVRTVTKDRQTFKDAIRNMKADNHPNGDCPEMALSGIELALKSSREASFLFVYTDATAKDYEKLDEVVALSQKMRSQVVFVLTGDCGNRKSRKYLAYRKLAKATQGQVFHMEKKNMGEIFNYVKNTIENRKNVIASKTYPAGYGNQFSVDVDGDTKELVISVSGTNPSVDVTDSDGAKVPTKDLTRLPQIKIVNVRGVKPGVYKVEVGSESETDVLVTGTTTVHFQHGFSVFQPTAITETATRPVKGEKSYISIKLDTEGGKVELHTIQILDMNDKVELETPLKLLDAAEQFYTTGPVLPPNHYFRIAIRGYHNESKTDITRISLTPIQPQETPKGVAVLEKAPEVSVDGAVKLEAKYNEELQLKCKVSGYPKPNIIWESDDPTAVLSHTVSVVELPYIFISFLHVQKVKKNSVYTCKAVNKLNSDSKSITVKLKYFFNVLEKPRDIAIEYQKSGQVFCKASAFPPATASWYRGRRPLRSDAAARLSADNSSLAIRSMEPRLAGDYVCEIRNEFNRKKIPFTISITGVEKPNINKIKSTIKALKNSNVNITCDVLQGKPTPSIAWFYGEGPSSVSKLTRLGETAAALRMRDVGAARAGLYRCVATNAVGEDHHDVMLIVEYPPSQSASTSALVAANEGDTVSLPCPAAGAPPPAFTWRRDGAALPPAHYTILRDGSLRFKASNSDGGDFECEAKNEHGAVRINVKVEIYAPVNIEPPAASRVSATVGAAVALPCRARGLPAPRLAWLFHSRNPAAAPVHYAPSDTSGSLLINKIQKTQEGVYTCVASNVVGSKNITYTVNVIVPILEKSPELTIDRGDKVEVNYNEELKLKCNVNGYPKPDIFWESNDPTAKWSHTESVVELPYEYMSYIYIKNVKKDGSVYTCKAVNKLSTTSKSIAVQIKHFLEVLEVPRDTIIEYKKSGQVFCKASAFPPATASWYRGRWPLVSDAAARLSADNSSLAIRSMEPRLAGEYTCVIRNDFYEKKATFTISITGVEKPNINKSKSTIKTLKNSNVNITCDVLQGKPAPNIAWFYGEGPSSVSKLTRLGETAAALRMRDVGTARGGLYRCVATNAFGEDHHDIMMIVEYPPSQSASTSALVAANEGDTVSLPCPAAGAPPPAFTWRRDGAALPPAHYTILRDGSLRFKASNSDGGDFECESKNEHGAVRINVKVEIHAPVNIEPPAASRVSATVGAAVALPCRARGRPAPRLAWLFHSRDPAAAPVHYAPSDTTGSLLINKIQKTQEGVYTCVASNIVGSKNINYTVNVTVPILEKSPEVTIDRGDEVEVNYNEELKLKCKVNGYPKPDIIWESNDPTAEWSHTESVVELPYEYMSYIHIKNVKKDSVYTCKAFNKLGTISKSIAVQVKHFFEVLDMPRDTTIEYKKSGQVFCKASAYPPATASWYRGRRPLRSDAAARLSADNSSLAISSMEPHLAGDYICEIRNEFNRTFFPFTITITGVERPKINKNYYLIETLKHSNIYIPCSVFRGKPTPSIAWFHGEGYSPFGKLTRLGETAAALRIRDVGTEHGGLYRCVAKNAVGRDVHDINVVVEYPPARSASTSERVAAGEGDTVSLPCPAAGAPPPAFTWRRDGAALPSARYTVFRDGTLRFIASSNDSGHYECKAQNVHGETLINVDVEINAPVDIERPAASRVSATVGAAVALPCRARGRPAPRLAWLFHSRDPAAAPVHYAPSDSSGSLHIKTIQTEQDGSYTCVASNDASSMNITYTVDVLAPPSISYAAKRFVGVAGDAVLRLPCRAAGRPAPAVSWARGGLPVPVGSPWYALAADGALLLRDLDARAAGRYVCRAENSLGTTNEAFEAVVLPAPAPAPPRAPSWLAEGQAAAVPCPVPRRNTDRLLWFKDGRMISNGELVLKNVSRRDAGLYACRVSSFTGAQTGSTQVEVGWKPRFTFNDTKDIEFELGSFAAMDCHATGKPTPEVQWFHDDVPLDDISFTHEVEMSGPRDKGRYTCVVSNKFGSVQQEYEIATFECSLDIKKDFNGKSPLMLTRYLELNQFDTSDGQVHISRGESIVLICPAGFNNNPQQRIDVKCVNGKQFIFDDDDSKRFLFSDFKCRLNIVPEVKKTGIPCTNDNSELISVGFQIPRRFIEIYQICLDRATDNTIYTKQYVSLTEANVLPEYDIEWFDSRSGFNLDRLYDCGHQNDIISSVLGKDFHRSDGCCFGRRQLVSPRDLAPGPPQAAAYTALNVAPQWGTCNSQNWEELEARVRKLARVARRRLTVWSGAARSLWLRDAAGAPRDVYLSDGRDYHQVPELFWKVVQDPASNASLAMVQVNVPDLEDAQDYHLCPDVCSQVDWMRDRRWRSVERGYTYCCRLEDFERALSLQGAFPPRRALLQAAAPHLHL